jgi:uncharacterized damage-inducible protein DinB
MRKKDQASAAESVTTRSKRVQPRRETRLVHDALGGALVGNVQDFDRYGSIEDGVVGLPDDAHPALAYALHDPVRADRRAGGRFDGIGGRGVLYGPSIHVGSHSRSKQPEDAVRVKAAFGVLVLILVGLVLPSRAAAQQPPPNVGEGWNGEFEHAARQLAQLGAAIPPEKFSWRPAPGVRSTAEVYMHIAVANIYLLGLAGVKTPVDLSKLGKDPEKSLTAKADVLKFLEESFTAVRNRAPQVDRAAKVKLFGKEVTGEGLLLRVLVHNHEHMGQLIAYARVNAIVPPWSASGGQ